MRRILTTVVALVVLIVPLAATEAFANTEHGGPNGVGPVRAATYNLYVGADIFRINDAEDPEDIPLIVAEIMQIVMATDFPERSHAIADQIAKNRPHLIGLQEVSLIRTQSPGDSIIGGTIPAEDVLYDYLNLLLDALAARGLRYEVAAVVENADVELPMFAGIGDSGPLFDDIRLTDRDVILAQRGVKTSNEMAANYTNNLIIPIAGTDVEFLRGYVAVDAKIRKSWYRFVNTHLEVWFPDPIPNIQGAQAFELATGLAPETKPIILVGDFNSSPEDIPADLPPYWIMTAAGYVDTWTRRVGKPRKGFTCCQNETLTNPVSLLDERIDLIFVRNDTDFPAWPDLGPVKARVLGARERDKTPSGLWPSDHAGVAAKLIIPVRWK